MRNIILFLLLLPISINAQQTKSYFVLLTSNPMTNPSSAIMAIHTASEALKQGHQVTFFAAGDGVRILIKDVIQNLHTVTSHGGGSPKISQMAIQKLLDFSNEGGVIHVSEGSFKTYGVTQENHNEKLLSVKLINWSYPKQLIQESSKSDFVFSY